jgi:hypothetical protein
MSKRILKPVAAKVVRQFAFDGKVTVTDAALACVTTGPQGRGRGRLHPDLIAAFNAENGEGLVYNESEGKALAGRFVTLPITKTNARGAVLNRPEQFPIAEVRTLAGVVGKKGRLSKADVAKAAEAVMAARAQA